MQSYNQHNTGHSRMYTYATAFCTLYGVFFVEGLYPLFYINYLTNKEMPVTYTPHTTLFYALTKY